MDGEAVAALDLQPVEGDVARNSLLHEIHADGLVQER